MERGPEEQIIAANGSVQNIPEVPQNLKDLKTAYEISQKAIIDMAADRWAFICREPEPEPLPGEPQLRQMTSMHFYSWKAGLKTGMYHLRSKAATDAIKFTVDRKLEQPAGEGGRARHGRRQRKHHGADAAAQIACSLDYPDRLRDVQRISTRGTLWSGRGGRWGPLSFRVTGPMLPQQVAAHLQRPGLVQVAGVHRRGSRATCGGVQHPVPIRPHHLAHRSTCCLHGAFSPVIHQPLPVGKGHTKRSVPWPRSMRASSRSEP